MNTIDSITLNSLLADKQSADSRLKKALKFREFYSEQIDGKEDSGLFSERIVTIVDKSNSTARLLGYVDAVKAANKALLEAAPQYFDATSNFFKEPTVLNNVTRVHITTNKAVSSHKITGAVILKRLHSFVKKQQKSLITASSKEEIDAIEELILEAKREIVYYSDNLDTEFRRRGASHNDIVAIYHTFGGRKKKQPVNKAHVTAGGMIIVKHTSCKPNDIVYSDQSAENYSIYSEANGFSCVLYPKATMYEEKEIELLREARKEIRGKNENKQRGQFDGYVN